MTNFSSLEVARTRCSTWQSALRGPRFIWLILPLLWALTYLPQLGARDLRLEEGRRATPAAEMLQTGDFVTPRLYGEPYLNKPPLFFWIAAAAGKIQGGVTALSVRIPSTLSVLLGAWLLLFFARRQLPGDVRALAALLLLSTPFMLDKGTLGEIDAALSLLVFASLAAIWAAFDGRRIRWWGWGLSGIILSLALLMKGPPGLIEFYAVLVSFFFLAGRGRWKALFVPGHLLMLLLAAAPAALWVSAVAAETGKSFAELTLLWRNQMGVDAITDGSASAGLAYHYKTFLYRTFSMLLPWIFPAVAAMLPSFAVSTRGSATHADAPAAAPHRPSPDSAALRLLLAISILSLLVIFFAWPRASPRHMMMVAYPVAVLAAIAATHPWPRWASLFPLLRGAAAIMSIAIGVVSIVALILAAKLFPPALPVTCVVAAITMLIAAGSWRLTINSPLEQPLACAASLAILIMLGWGCISSVFLPYKARTDKARIVHEQIDRIVPKNYPIYTTRTLSQGKGDDYYNQQFYLRSIQGDPIALKDFSLLFADPSVNVATVILTQDELPAFHALFPEARELGTLYAPSGPSPVLVMEARRPAASSPASPSM